MSVVYLLHCSISDQAAALGFGVDIVDGVTLEAPAQGLRVALDGRGVLPLEARRDCGTAVRLGRSPETRGRRAWARS